MPHRKYPLQALIQVLYKGGVAKRQNAYKSSRVSEQEIAFIALTQVLPLFISNDC